MTHDNREIYEAYLNYIAGEIMDITTRPAPSFNSCEPLDCEDLLKNYLDDIEYSPSPAQLSLIPTCDIGDGYLEISGFTQANYFEVTDCCKTLSRHTCLTPAIAHFMAIVTGK